VAWVLNRSITTVDWDPDSPTRNVCLDSRQSLDSVCRPWRDVQDYILIDHAGKLLAAQSHHLAKRRDLLLLRAAFI
jgi:hypothetical protein